MFGSRRWLSTLLSLLSAALVSIVLAPQTASAHSFIPDGHQSIWSRITPFTYALFTLALLICACAIVTWTIRRQQQGLSAGRLPLLLFLVVLLSVAAACKLSVEQQVQNGFTLPNSANWERPLRGDKTFSILFH